MMPSTVKDSMLVRPLEDRREEAEKGMLLPWHSCYCIERERERERERNRGAFEGVEKCSANLRNSLFALISF